MVVGVCINLLVGCILSNCTFSKYRSRPFKKGWFIFASCAVYLMITKDKMKETAMVLSRYRCTCSNADVRKGLLIWGYILWSKTAGDQ